MLPVSKVDPFLLGQTIKAIRELRGLKQQYVAAQVQLMQSVYSSLEHGTKRFYFDKFIEICHVLEVSPFLVMYCAGFPSAYPNWFLVTYEERDKQLINAVQQRLISGGG